MRTIVRKYNYTGRVRIPREFVKITEHDPGGTKWFTANFQLESLELPDNARVFVEPYFKSSFMRFDFGYVGKISPPPSTALLDIPSTERILYRVKVVEYSSGTGLILAFADAIRAESSHKPTGRESLLPVDFNDLGNRTWKLDFRDEGPVLSVNHSDRIEPIGEIVRSPWFISIVYPEVVRQITHRILTDEEYDLNEPSDWAEKWLRYFREILSISIDSRPKNDEHLEEAVEEVVDAFCHKYDVIRILLESYANSETK